MPRPSSALLPRPRLRQKLEAGLCAGDGTFARKLTLLSAPAGFGKTTLLAQWLAHADLPVVWLSLDKGDDEPSRFLHYLFAVLQGVDQTLARAALAHLRSAQSPLPHSLLAQLINDASQLRRAFILVVDDYHYVDNAQVHEALAFLLQQLPSTMHLVVSSRATPPWPLARLRALGQMVEVRAADLRFTLQESTAFLNEVMDLGLNLQEIASLDARAEGWITALQLAALALQERQDKASFIEAFGGSHRFILDYLLEEVLDRQPGAVRQFLLQTSVLDRLCAPLCDAIVEIGEWRSEIGDRLDSSLISNGPSQALLQYLERANLFLIPLDEERRWYRYHHLFADLLHMRLQQGVAGQVPGLHARASLWYEQQGLLVDAVRHALRAGDGRRVARLVVGNCLAMMEDSELCTMERWLSALSSQALDPSPWLQVVHAWILVFVGDLARARAVLRAIEAGGHEAQGLSGHLAARSPSWSFSRPVSERYYNCCPRPSRMPKWLRNCSSPSTRCALTSRTFTAN